MSSLGAPGNHLLQMQDYLQEASCCAFSLDQARQVKIMVGQCKFNESFGEVRSLGSDDSPSPTVF